MATETTTMEYIFGRPWKKLCWKYHS